MRLLLLLLAALPLWTANLAYEGRAHSWQLQRDLPAINDASFHTCAALSPEQLPVDAGIEWAVPHRVGSVILRYYDGRMVRTPAAARTQDWGRVQVWSGERWKDVDTQRAGEEQSSARYQFPPVETTRVRFLISEPPDPEARHAPGRLGISVCEMEVYENVPFQIVRSGGRLAKTVRKNSYLHSYNEPPGGDSSYEIAGPLIIEPKQSKVFRDKVEPTLVPADLPQAAVPCSAVRDGGSVILQNGFLEFWLNGEDGRPLSILNKLTDERVALRPTLEPGVHQFRIGNCEIQVDAVQGDLSTARHFQLSKGDHWLSTWLVFRNTTARSVPLHDITVSSLGLPDTIDLMAGQELTYPIYRDRQGGVFEALETIYWDHRGDSLTYHPGSAIKPGQTYESVKASIGVYKNRGELIAGWDRGLREWVTAYHDRVSPLATEWPEVYCEGWTADLSLKRFREQPKEIENFFQLGSQLGIRYADTYDPSHQAIPLGSDLLSRFVSLAFHYGVGTGWWNDFGADNAWAGTVIPRKPFACKLSPEAESFYSEVIQSARKYQLRAMHLADFLTIWPCDHEEHGHLPGKYSIYAQGQRILQFAAQLKEASPEILLGADGGFTNPQLVRSTDGRGNAWFVDPADKFSAMEPDIHLDRLTASRNRVYAWGAHTTNLIPWPRLINWVNHFGYVSHLHDRAGFRYALLSAIAMAPQLTYNDVPDSMPEADVQFAQTWSAWARKNADLLRYGDKLLDRSVRFEDIWQGDADSLSGFSHIRHGRGFIFLENPTAVQHTAELTLAIDGDQFAVRELYPGHAAQTVKSGAKLRMNVPSKQVLVLEVFPGAAPAVPETAYDAHYVSDWRVVSHDSERAVLSAAFQAPPRYLKSPVPENLWSQNPWGFEKAYLVLYLKDETVELNNYLTPDKLELSLKVNGVERKLYPFQSKRYVIEGKTRAWFAELTDAENHAELTLPIRSGLVFEGALVDVPE